MVTNTATVAHDAYTVETTYGRPTYYSVYVYHLLK